MKLSVVVVLVVCCIAGSQCGSIRRHRRTQEQPCACPAYQADCVDPEYEMGECCSYPVCPNGPNCAYAHGTIQAGEEAQYEEEGCTITCSCFGHAQSMCHMACNID